MLKGICGLKEFVVNKFRAKNHTHTIQAANGYNNFKRTPDLDTKRV